MDEQAKGDDAAQPPPPSPGLDDVEEAIRRAEELMSRDFEMLIQQDPAAKGAAVGAQEEFQASNSAVKVPLGQQQQQQHEEQRHEKDNLVSSLVSPGNRYKDSKAREELIEKLLLEREQALEAEEQVKVMSQELARKDHEFQLEQQQRLERQLATTEEHVSHAKRKATHKARQPPSSTGTQKTRRDRARSKPKQMSGSGSRATKAVTGQAGEHGSFRRKSLDQVKRQVELERSRDCTFRPKIVSYDQLKPETAEQRLARLARPRSEYWQRIDQQRQELEQEQLQQECTFQPDISVTQAQLEKGESEWERRLRDAYRTRIPVEERLHSDASERWASRQRAKRELEEAEVQAQPFRPRVNVVSEEIARQIQYEPIQQRASRVQREKEERLARKKLEVELGDENLTFQPQINRASERMAMSASIRRGEAPTKDVVHRLTSRANSVHEKKKGRERAWAEQQEQECRFKPAVSKNSKKLLAKNPLYKENVDFMQRQAAMEKERQRRDVQRRAQVNDMGGVATFKPKLHNPDRILVHARPERLVETDEQRYERLANKDSERKERLQASIREHYYAQYEFRPKINRVSREIVRETHKAGQELYEDLHRNERGRYFREAAQSEVEGETLKECTFKPKTLSRPNASASEFIKNSRFCSEDTVKLIENKRRQKELRRLQLKREQEYQELEKCTFTPEVNDAIVKADRPCVVRGLGRFLELQELAKKKQEDQRERANKVFLEQVEDLRPEPYTVPKPFKLSSSNRSGSRGRGQPKYSFQPETRIGAQRKQIQRLLSS